MAIRGFDRFAAMLNDHELILRKVIHLQAKDSISGADLLSGENLVSICLKFDCCELYFICLGETDEIEISATSPRGHFVSRDLSKEAPWDYTIGAALFNIWQLSNANGYDDGVSLQFRKSGSANIRILLESIASQFSISEVNPIHASPVIHA